MLNVKQKEESTESVQMRVVKGKSDPLDERYYGRPIRVHIREFSIVFSILFLIVGGILTWKRYELAPSIIAIGASLVLVSLGNRSPALLKPFWQAWMKFALFLGMVVTFVILSVVWIVLAIPMSLIMRAVRKRVLDMTFRTNAESHWEVRDPKLGDFKLLERQF